MTDFPLACRDDPAAVPLAGWRDNVGSPLALDVAPASASDVRTLFVLSWNVWIGRGDVVGLVSRIRDGAFAADGDAADAPLIALLQEAYRADDSVPEACTGSHGGSRHRLHADDHDIRVVAERLGMNLRYAPSMRNGTHRSDRGNAILSTLPLFDAAATELPLARQRRVAVSASIRAGRGVLRLHSAHLDPRGRGSRDILGTAGRLLQVRGLIESLDVEDGVPHILGADLNLARQRREPAFRALTAAGFATGVPPRDPTWRHTYHRVPRLILDWLLVLNRGAVICGAAVRRLDEHPRDRGPAVFGSDHHPLLARIDLTP